MDLDYNTRLAAIQRNEKLAQIMQQQAFQPVEIQSYNGIQAPISPLSGLAKVLQAYMGAKGTGEEERIKLNQEAKAEAQSLLSGLQDRPATQGRAAVMGMPEIPAQPATSFKPMGSDFEDNPNLQAAPSGNVETPAVPYQPAVAPQAAIPAQPAVQMTPELKRQRLVEMMMGQNPYAAPVAKLMYESLEKENTGPLAEYRLAVQQGYKGTIDQYKTQQAQAGRSITNVSMPTSMAPMYVKNRVTGKMEYVQPNNRGTFDLSNYEPAPTETSFAQKLKDAGITPDNPQFQQLAQALINKELLIQSQPGQINTPAGQAPPAFVPKTPEGASLNPMNRDAQGNLIVTPTPGASAANAAYQGAQTTATESAKAGQDLVPVFVNGKEVFLPRSEVLAQANAGAPALVKPDVKTTQGQTVLDLAAKAKEVLPQATSGFISNLATMATDASGIPTNKSAADAQLRVISGALTSNVPRMEGPQSNADVALYKQSAADVANPNIPYQTRMKALETVIQLNEKYAATPSAPPAGAVRRVTPK